MKTNEKDQNVNREKLKDQTKLNSS